MLSVKDFSLEKYEFLLKIIQNKYHIMTVSDYIENGSKNMSKIAIMRHDVDRNIDTALEMANVEKKLGVNSTYYFRYPQTFTIEVIKEIEKMGHEIGYHYETLSKEKGNYSNAIKTFENELSKFNNYFNIKTVCAHGALSLFRNLDLWEVYDYKKWNLIGEAYLSLRGLPYYSDTSRRWGKYNNTDEMIDSFTKKNDDVVYFLVHPGRWPKGRYQWYIVRGKDLLFNMGKYFGKGLIKMINKVKN